MHGNVWEWCQDTWHESYKGAPSDGSAWIDNDSKIRTLRGGSWYDLPGKCRSASRNLTLGWVATHPQQSWFSGCRFSRWETPSPLYFFPLPFFSVAKRNDLEFLKKN